MYNGTQPRMWVGLGLIVRLGFGVLSNRTGIFEDMFDNLDKKVQREKFELLRNSLCVRLANEGEDPCAILAV